ncbi:MAG: hypothetical protein K8S27_06590 [Candidatus Omnitrophica bacterium]|nr:hypothetical protein [Candidatus Omnitrophota bacterium]
MMNNNTIRMIVGLFFLFYGLLSLSAIIHRGSQHFFDQDKPYLQRHKTSLQDFSSAGKELSQRLNRPIHFRVQVNRQYSIDKFALRMFFGVVAMEYCLSFFYVFTGIALVRKYYFGTFLFQSVLLYDIMLKMFFKFVLYYFFQQWPDTIQVYKLLLGYFIPNCGLMSYVSGLLTGAVFVSQSRFLFMAYGLMIVCSIFFIFKMNVNNTKHG